MHGLHRFDEAVSKRAVEIHSAPHQTLHDAGYPHGSDVEHDADGGDPEVQLDQPQAVELAPEEPRNEVVHGAEGNQRHPAERAGVHVTNGPVGVMRQRIDRLDRHHGSLEGRHAIEGHRHDQEPQNRIRAKLLPCSRQGHDAVDHPTPGRREQNDRHDHAERLGPIGQRGIVQVMRACPYVGEDERPEMHDGEPIRVYRPIGLLRHEVVHHAEKARGQEKSDCIVPVPPLHHGILHARVDRVRFPQAHRQRRAVDHVQHCDGDYEGGEEPVRHVDVLDAALDDGAEEHDRVDHPDDRNQKIDGPLELGVFLCRGDTERQGDGCQHDDSLPAPEGECGQLVRDQSHLAGALHHIVRGREQRRSAEREDHRVGVQRSQAAERQPRHVEVERRPRQLGGDEHAHQHADDAPHDGHHGELPHDPVVIRLCFCHLILRERGRHRQLVNAGAIPGVPHSSAVMASSATRVTRPNASIADEKRKPRSGGISIMTGTPE